MPPALALLVFLAFVAALLWIDHKRSAEVSTALWIPTLWFLYSASRPVSEWFRVASADGTVESGNPIERNILTLLILTGFFILGRGKFNWAQTFRNNRWLIILFLYMLVSIIWSDFMLISFKRWFKTAGSFVMALIVLREVSPYEAIQAVFRRMAYILIPFSVMLVKYFHEFGVSYGRYNGAESWRGATQSKNSLGVLCMVSALSIIWALIRRREGKEPGSVRYQTWADLVVLAMAFWLLKGPGGSYSATSIAVMVVGIATFFVLRRLKARVAYLGKVAGLALLGVGLIFFFTRFGMGISPMEVIAPMLGRDATLTGRTDVIWDVLIPIAMENPIMGVGYGAFWIRPIDFDLHFSVNEAHNGYLDVFIELGVVGLMLLPFVVVECFQRARFECEREFDWGALRISFLFMMLLHNIAETSFLRSRELIWNVFILLMVAIPESNPWYSEDIEDHDAQVEGEPHEQTAALCENG